jgi:hypothetical protein
MVCWDVTPCNLVGWCQIFGRICCLQFNIERVKFVEKDSIDAGHGGQKPVGGVSTKGQFVNGKECINSEEEESFKKIFRAI